MWLQRDFYLWMVSDVSILFYFDLLFLYTGKDQAYSANSDGEGTQGTADIRGTKSDPTAPLIKQNIPG